MLSSPETAQEHQRILSGTDAQAQVGRLSALRFSKFLAESIHDTPPIIFPRIRERIRAIFNGPLVLVNRELPLHWLYPYPSDTEATLSIYLEIRKMLRDRTLLAAMVGEKLAGIAGFMEVARLEKDKPVIELRRTVVDPAHRGKKIYPALANERFKRLQERPSPALIINATRQPSVIRWSGENQFSEIDWRRFYMEYKRNEFSKSEARSFEDRVKRFGWRYFERNIQGAAEPECQNGDDPERYSFA